MDLARPESFRRDARVIGLVGVAHGISHFFQLALPPLFPLLRAEFDVSWTLLGALVGVFYAASGISQFVAGFAVDRFGARPVLLGGLALARRRHRRSRRFAPGVGWLFPIVALMGVGNGVFHPADFAILNANVAPRRLGHAYSTHGVGGNLGYALAPIVSFALGARVRLARGARGAWASIGLVALGVLASAARATSTSHRAADAHTHTLAGSVGAVPAAGDPAVLRLLRRPDDGVGRPADVPADGAERRASASRSRSRPRRSPRICWAAAAGIVAGGFLAARTDASRPRRRRRTAARRRGARAGRDRAPFRRRCCCRCSR